MTEASTNCVPATIEYAGLADAGFLPGGSSSGGPLSGMIPSLPVSSLLHESAEFAPELVRMVRGLAGRLHARLPQGCGIELSDLIQAGNVGLLKAAHSFQSCRGAPLALYAKFRIRGEMLDMVRRNAGRERAGPFLLSPGSDNPEGEGGIPAPPESSPHSSVLKQQRAAIIWEELQRLPQRDRAVVRLRYSGEMTLRQIGAALHVNESRACQIHQSALVRLKRALWNRGVRDFSHL